MRTSVSIAVAVLAVIGVLAMDSERAEGQMSTIVNELLDSLRLGEMVIYDNLAIVPLFSDINHSPAYLTLQEALSKKLIVISEISDGGSVPELKVTNKSDLPVLLLDGEELVGAKQNRVLNTTILLKERSETVIPVSCTERGRWSPRHAGLRMEESTFIHSPRMREKKAKSVSQSLSDSKTYRSDQGIVWDEIDQRSREAGVHSPTGAMKEVVEKKEKDLDDYCRHFQSLTDQRGLLVFINGRIVGMDWISFRPAFEQLHAKLVKSYALDAMLLRHEKTTEPTLEAAKSFLKVKIIEAREFDSVGYGKDVRIQQPELVGFALVHEKTIIHCALFPVAESDSVR